MANKIHTSRFFRNGSPALGLTPQITIYELDPNLPAVSTTVVNAQNMTEVGDGWYRYDFTSYDLSKDYTVSVDGGASLPVHDRHQSGANDSFKEETAYATWEETDNHVTVGTMGYLQNQISSDVTQIRIDTTALLSLVGTLLKYQENRTKIDKTAKTLTVYDNDGTTPLKVFDLRDSAGVLSVTEVLERDPQ